MKNLLFILFIFLNYWNIEAQYFSTLNSDLNISPTTDNNIVNVNMKTYTHTNSEFINEEHTITGNIITMNVCYWVTGLQFANNYQHTFPVNVPIDDDYTIIINLYSSLTQGTCDYTELTDTVTLDFTTPLTSTVSLSVSEFEQIENQINVYPNPVNNFLRFSISGNLNINAIELYSVLGKKIDTKYNNEFNKINVSNLNNGIYFVIFHTDKGLVEKKIIINN